MAKRKRPDKQTSAMPVAGTATDPRGTTAEPARKAPEIDPAVALFAQRHREGIERDKQRQRDRAAEQRKAGEHTRLVEAKDQAVANLKRINRATGATQDDRDAAEAAYRSATADVITHETGDRPDWAPAPEPSEEDLASVEVEPGHSGESAEADPASEEANDDGTEPD